jgi:hypothetical protein
MLNLDCVANRPIINMCCHVHVHASMPPCLQKQRDDSQSKNCPPKKTETAFDASQVTSYSIPESTAYVISVCCLAYIAIVALVVKLTIYPLLVTLAKCLCWFVVYPVHIYVYLYAINIVRVLRA